MCRCYENDLMSAREEISYIERMLKAEKVQDRTNPTYRALIGLSVICRAHHAQIVGQEVVETYCYYANIERAEKIRKFRDTFLNKGLAAAMSLGD